MTAPWVWYGRERVELDLPSTLDTTLVVPRTSTAPPDEMGVVAHALDHPVDGPAIGDLAVGAKHVAVVVPDASRASGADRYLLPLVARLAMARHGPRSLSVIVARGLHAAASRNEVAATVGREVMQSLRPVQSAPDGPDLNVVIGVHEALGPIRIHRLVAEADLVVLTGAVSPHHLAGFGGGAKALVPGVAERDTVHAAHRLTLRTVLRPDGAVRSVAGTLAANPFREALHEAVELHGRCRLLNVVLDAQGRIAAAVSGGVRAGHAAAVHAWEAVHGAPPALEPADLVIVGTRSPRDRDLIQAHKGLLAAQPFARPGAAVIWLAPARAGPGHPSLLPWFQIRGLERHLAALRQQFEPYGLTAYSLRRLARDHPVHVVSEMDRDLLRPMGLLPAASAAEAVRRVLEDPALRTCTVLPDGAW